MDTAQERLEKAREELEENTKNTRLQLRKRVEAVAAQDGIGIPEAIQGVIYRDKDEA